MNTRTVAATANTPSLKASARLFVTQTTLLRAYACVLLWLLKRRAFSRLPHEAMVHHRLE